MLESRRDTVEVLTRLVAVSTRQQRGIRGPRSGLWQCTDAHRAGEDPATAARLEKLFLSLG